MLRSSSAHLTVPLEFLILAKAFSHLSEQTLVSVVLAREVVVGVVVIEGLCALVVSPSICVMKTAATDPPETIATRAPRATRAFFENTLVR